MSKYIEHGDGETEDDRTLLRLAEELQGEWKMGGLSDGLYFEFAAEIATRFARLKVADEREACLLTIIQEMRDEQDSHDEYYNLALNRAVKAMRKRGE